VRFTAESGHLQGTRQCSLWATSGLMHCSKKDRYSITSQRSAGDEASQSFDDAKVVVMVIVVAIVGLTILMPLSRAWRRARPGKTKNCGATNFWKGI